MDIRPKLTKSISVTDFQDFYWLKAELIDFCRLESIPTSGSKAQLAARISEYLNTGIIIKQMPTKSKQIHSTFDWNTEMLTHQTVITDSYKNSQQVRAYFEAEIGKHFKFSVRFMRWMKENTGKTLSDAIIAYHQITKEAKSTIKKEIAPQFEYNTYLRDCLADNPGLSRKKAIALWKLKKSRRGHNRYEKKDLLLD